jgi:hypothetical protein
MECECLVTRHPVSVTARVTTGTGRLENFTPELDQRYQMGSPNLSPMLLGCLQ